MARRTEDEIQRKLVELEMAMKQEQVTAEMSSVTEDAIIVEDKDEHVQAQMTRVEKDIVAKEKKAKKGKNQLATGGGGGGLLTNAAVLELGGYSSLAAGLLILLSNIRVLPMYPIFGSSMGLTLIPMLVGIGMLIYNYKSRVAQVVTVASFAAVIYAVMTSFTLTFAGLSLLGLLILMVPVVLGVVLLAKANVAKREAKESTKQLK